MFCYNYVFILKTSLVAAEVLSAAGALVPNLKQTKRFFKHICKWQFFMDFAWILFADFNTEHIFSWQWRKWLVVINPCDGYFVEFACCNLDLDCGAVWRIFDVDTHRRWRFGDPTRDGGDSATLETVAAVATQRFPATRTLVLNLHKKYAKIIFKTLEIKITKSTSTLTQEKCAYYITLTEHLHNLPNHEEN